MIIYNWFVEPHVYNNDIITFFQKNMERIISEEKNYKS